MLLFIVTFEKDVLEKTPDSMVFKPDGITKSPDSLEQPLKASSPIVVKLVALEKFKVLIPKHCRNAELAIFVFPNFLILIFVHLILNFYTMRNFYLQDLLKSNQKYFYSL